MTESPFPSIADVVGDELFPDTDLALRRGRHVGRDDGAAYEFLVEASDHLEPFYRRFGCELVHRTDGYFFLLPSGEKLGRRHMTAGEMLVGQTLALLYLDPATLQHGGVVTRDVLLQRLSGLVGDETLVRTLSPRRRKFDERVAADAVRTRVADAIRRLAGLGFIDLVDEVHLRLRPALWRFADPVRDLTDPRDALKQLVIRGEVLLDESADPDDESGVAEGDDAT